MKNLDKMVGEILEFGSEKTGIGKQLIENVRELCIYTNIFNKLFIISLILLLVYIIFRYLVHIKVINWHGTEFEKNKLHRNALLWGLVSTVGMTILVFIKDDVREKINKQPEWFTNNLAKISGCECIKINPDIKKFDDKINQILEQQDALNKKIGNAVKTIPILGDFVQYILDFSFALFLLGILYILCFSLATTPFLILGYLKNYKNFKENI